MSETGLPQRPGAELYHYLGEVCPERQSETDALEREWDDTTRFNRLSAFSNANRVTIYPVDAGGIRASSSVDPSLSGPIGAADGGGAGGLRLSTVLVPSSQNDRLRGDNLQATLSLLADETGGRAVFNQAHPAASLEEIAADFGSYYSLGYAALPERRHPIRQIDVRLKQPRKGWRLRYRRSYILKSEEQRLADRLFAALKLNEQSNPLAIDVTFGEMEAAVGSKQFTLPVEVHVPFSEVTLLPGPSGRAGAVRIFLVAENEDGDRTPMRQKTLTLSEAQLPPPDGNAVVVVNVDLPPGTFAVAVGVRDEASGAQQLSGPGHRAAADQRFRPLSPRHSPRPARNASTSSAMISTSRPVWIGSSTVPPPHELQQDLHRPVAHRVGALPHLAVTQSLGQQVQLHRQDVGRR